MAILANLIVKLSANTTALEKGLKGAQGHMNKLSGVLKKGAIAGGVALAGLGVASLKMGMDFEKTMAEVKTLMPDISEKVFGEMKDDVLALCKEMGIATDKAVPALYQAISAGVPKENVMEFLRTGAKVAIGGVTDLETAVDGLTTITNAWGLSMAETSGIADTMFVGMAKGKTTIAEMSNFMFQAAPLASALAISAEEVVSSMASLTLTGTPTSVAMTQIRAAMVGISRENPKLVEALNASGFATAEQALASEGLMGTLALLNEAVGGHKGKLMEMLGSQEAVMVALGATGDAGEVFAGIMDEMADKAGRANEAFETISETTAYKLNVAINAIKVEMTRLGAEVLPVLVEGFENLEQIVADLTPILEDMGRQAHFLTSGLDDLQEDITSIGKAFGKLEGDTKIWIDVAITALKLGVSPLVLGFRVIIETMGLVAALFRGDWSDALSHFKDLALTPLKIAWWALGDVISTVMLGIGRIIESGINAIIPMLNTFVKWINSAVGAANAFSGLLGFDKLKIGTIPALKEVNFRLKDFESFLRGSTDAMRDFAYEGLSVDTILQRMGEGLAIGAGGGPGVDGGGGGGGGAGGGMNALAQAVDILTPGMAALNAEVEREEVFLVNVAKALTTATTQHDMITASIEAAERALRDAEGAMNDWENAVLQGTRAFSDMAFGISQDMDRLQLKMNELTLGALEEDLEGGGYASDTLTRKIQALAKILGVELFGGKADWDDLQKVLDAAGDAMGILRLESQNVGLRENLSLGPIEREWDQWLADQKGYVEVTLPEMKKGWLKAKDEVGFANAALDEWNNLNIVNEIHMTFLQGLLDNHRAYLTDIRDLYNEIATAAQAAWSAGAQMPAGTVTTPALPVPVYQQGGYVPRTGLALLHKGETVTPAGGGSAGTTVVNFNGPLLGDRRQLEAHARALKPYLDRMHR